MSIDVTTEFKTAFEESITSARLEFLILDKNDVLVDFSDRIGDGKNVLAFLGTLTLSHVSESREGTGSTHSSPASIKLDNSQGFFNEKFPSSLKTIDGAVASFDVTSNKKQSTLYNRECQFRITVVLKDGRTESGIIGDYLIGEMTRGLESFATVELTDKSLPLRREDSAVRVRDGYDFWKNKPIPFLLQECLKIRYRKSDGTLPSDFVIPDKVAIESAASIKGDSGDVRVVSHFGRQPEINDFGAWLNKGLICRALVMGPLAISLSDGGGPAGFSPGGASTPDVKTLYMGCDDELWSWNQLTEQSTLIDESTLGAGFNIRHLWYSVHQLKIYGVAYSIKSTYSGASSIQGETVKIFKYDGATFSIIATLSATSPDGVQTGDFCFRTGKASAGARQAGQTVSKTEGENVSMLYGQSVLYSRNNITFREMDTSLSTGVGGLPFKLEKTPFGTKFNTYYLVVDSTDPGNFHLRYSLGQKGFFVFNSKSITDIHIWYASFSDAPSAGPGTLRIKRINLVSGVSQTIVNDFDRGTGEKIDPLCGCPDTDSSSIYIGGVFWNEESSAASNGLIYKVASNGTLTKLYDAPVNGVSDDHFLTPIDMVHNEGGVGGLLVSLFARDRLGQSDAFVLATHSDTSSGDIGVKRSWRVRLSA